MQLARWVYHGQKSRVRPASMQLPLHGWFTTLCRIVFITIASKYDFVVVVGQHDHKSLGTKAACRAAPNAKTQEGLEWLQNCTPAQRSTAREKHCPEAARVLGIHVEDAIDLTGKVRCWQVTSTENSCLLANIRPACLLMPPPGLHLGWSQLAFLLSTTPALWAPAAVTGCVLVRGPAPETCESRHAIVARPHPALDDTSILQALFCSKEPCASEMQPTY
jgi:hypothetical protein